MIDHQHSSRSCTIFFSFYGLKTTPKVRIFSLGPNILIQIDDGYPKNVTAPMSFVNLLFHLPADRCLMIEQQAVDIERKCSFTCLVTIGSITTRSQDNETV